MGKDKSKRDRHLRAERDRKQRQGQPRVTVSTQHTPGVPVFDLSGGDPTKTTWVLCDGCGLPFSQPGTVAWTSDVPGTRIRNVTLGPCPRCGANGSPINVTTVSVGEFTYSSTDERAAIHLMETLAADLQAQRLTPEEAVGRLRQFGGVVTEFADWIEAHPKFIGVLGVILLALIPALRDAAEGAVRTVLREFVQHYEQLPSDGPGGAR